MNYSPLALFRLLPFVLLLLSFVSGHTQPGQNHALFIVIDTYDNWVDLQHPMSEADRLSRKIKDQYGFSTEILSNPDKRTIQQKLIDYQSKSYGKYDQLFIFFSGHGAFLDDTEEGFFVPADGILNDRFQDTYLAYSRLERRIDNIPCNHILLAIDACYSGTFDQEIARERGFGKRPGDSTEGFIYRELKPKSRIFLTSGSKERTPDNSAFSAAFEQALDQFVTDQKILTPISLLSFLEKASPKPHFGQFGRHEPSGSFLFIPTEIGKRFNKQAWAEVEQTGPALTDNLQKPKGEFGDLRPLGRVRRLPVDGAEASSFWSGQPQAMVDRNPANAWCSADGKTRGETVELFFKEPINLSKLGFYYPPDVTDGQRLKTATLEFSDGSKQRIELNNPDNWEEVMLTPVKTNQIKLTVNATSGGQDQGNYLYIYELAIYGQVLEVPEETEDYVPISGSKIEATSSWSGYPGTRAADGQEDTHWVSAQNRIKDEGLNVRFDSPKRLGRISIYNPEFPDDLRVKKAMLYFPDGTEQEISFRPLKGWQTIDFPPKQTRSFELIVTEVMGREAVDYIAIYEMEFYEKE